MNLIYWAHLEEHTDINNQGYIGVTSQTLEKRQKKHFEDTKANSQYTFHRAIRKYNNKIIWDVVAEYENEKDAYSFENQLRPKENIGWNNAIGGGKPPVAKKGRKHKGFIRKIEQEDINYILKSNESSNSLAKKYNVAKSSILRLRKKHNIFLENNLIDKNIYIFSHPEYGQHISTQLDFRKKYNIKSSTKVSKIINGKNKTHLGWSCLGIVN